MKTLSLLMIMYFSCLVVIVAQTPNSFKYQAVIRNSSGNILAEKQIGLRISIVQGSANGSPVYTETFKVNTNPYGVVNLNIGEGTSVLGSFAGINWGSGISFIKIEIDETGGTNYADIGTSQLLSVPYAMYAEKAGNAFSGSYNDLTNKPTLATVATTGSYNDLANKPTLATVATSGNYNDLTNKPTLAAVATTGSYKNLVDTPNINNCLKKSLDSIMLNSTNFKYSLKVDDNGNLVTRRIYTWSQLASLPLQRYGAVAFVLNNKAYVGLGRTTQIGTCLKDFWEYDPSTNKWTQKADFPGGIRADAASFVINNKGYVCGGANFFAPGVNYLYKDLYEYNATTDTWTQKADFIGVARYDHKAFAIGSYGYVGCGSYDNGSNYLSDMYKYDPSANAWTAIASVPGGQRSTGVAFSRGNYGYFGTGYSAGPVLKSDFYKYDPTNNTWLQIADYPAACCFQMSFVVNGNAYVGAGLTGTAGSTKIYNQIHQYNPTTNAWTKIELSTSFVPRAYPLGFTIGNTGYICTGSADSGSISDLWSLN